MTPFPDITLIIGTDASGKDHVANILANMIKEKGGSYEKRKRFLTGKVTTRTSSSGKSGFELFLEKAFISLYPYFSILLPPMLNLLLQKDLAKFKQSDKKLIIIGHNCLRGLAFHWGHRYKNTSTIPVSEGLRKNLQKMCNLTGLHTIVLDVDDHIRRERIIERQSCGEADNFDMYMAANSTRSERIESCLVWLAEKHLRGQLIENNDLPEEELRRLLLSGFAEKT